MTQTMSAAAARKASKKTQHVRSTGAWITLLLLIVAALLVLSPLLVLTVNAFKTSADYNATGPRRKELATAVGAILEATPVNQKAPTYAFAIGEYIIDRDGTLIGTENHALTEALAEQGFTVA